MYGRQTTLQKGDEHMYISIDGRSEAFEQETLPAQWKLFVRPCPNSDYSLCISGLRCTLKNIGSISRVLGDSVEEIRNKFVKVGHSRAAVFLKEGDKEDMIVLQNQLSRMVCSCHFTLFIVES